MTGYSGCAEPLPSAARDRNARPSALRLRGEAGAPGGWRRHLIPLQARIQAGRLDRRLGEEVDPRSSSLLLVRARQLLSERMRRSLARGFELALEESDASAAARRIGIPVNRDAVRDAAPALETLVARLRDGEAVSPQGVAMAKAILCDGAGPLYGRQSPAKLLSAATAARSALERGPNL